MTPHETADIAARTVLTFEHQQIEGKRELHCNAFLVARETNATPQQVDDARVKLLKGLGLDE